MTDTLQSSRRDVPPHQHAAICEVLLLVQHRAYRASLAQYPFAADHSRHLLN